MAHCLRVQPIHNDVTDDNVVGLEDSTGLVQPHGLIDFGDMARRFPLSLDLPPSHPPIPPSRSQCRSWLVAELSNTLVSILPHQPDSWRTVLEAVKAFHAILPLTEEEVSVLWPLVVLRGCQLNVGGEKLLAGDPANAAVQGALELAWLGFTCSSAVAFEEAETAVREVLGMLQGGN